MVLPKETIDEIVRRIVAVASPTRIILFGSHARGDADEDSDVDLLVVVEETESRRETTIQLYKALKGIGIAKDVVVTHKDVFEKYKTVLGALEREASEEGKVIYEQVA